MMRVSLREHGFTIALAAIALLAQAGHAGSNPHSNPYESGGEDDRPFVAQHIEKKATITLHGDIETVWPLFDPVNESKWAPVWNPEIIHPRNRVGPSWRAPNRLHLNNPPVPNLLRQLASAVLIEDSFVVTCEGYHEVSQADASGPILDLGTRQCLVPEIRNVGVPPERG